MGMFLKELKRLMALRGLTSANVEEKSKKKVKYSHIQSFFRGSLPQHRETIEELAKLLGVDSATLKVLAITEMTDRACEKFGISKAEAFGSIRQQSTAAKKIPVVPLSGLLPFLSGDGTPSKKAESYIDNFGNFEKDTYGVILEDRIFGDCVSPGDIAILSGDPRWKRGLEDYGIVGAKSGIYGGKILDFSKGITVQKVEPYSAEFIEKKEVLFVHRLIGMLRVAKSKRR